MYHKLKWISFIVASIVVIAACESNKPKEVVVEQPIIVEETPIADIQYTVVSRYTHDVTAFTEGLLFHNNKLFESTGAPENLPQTKSLFGVVSLKTGKIDVKAELDKTIYFGEGIVILKGKVFQVTYRNQMGFIYDAKTFKNIDTFNYANKEGWGLTTDGKSIIMSDGSSYLTYIDPDSFVVTKVLAVKEGSYDLIYLNELEYINGFIYANIYTTNNIVKIDPVSGKVIGKIDISSLLNESKGINPNSLETNGIAYDSITDKILVTGKLWPTIYEIKFPH